jgi:ankyrin repeat protein
MFRKVIGGLSFVAVISLAVFAFLRAAEINALEEMAADSHLHKPVVHNPDVARLFDPVYAGEIEKVRALLAEGVDVNMTDEYGQTALHITQDEAIAALLIAHGADVHTRDLDYQMTPIFNKDIAIAKLLVEAGADIHARSKKGNTLLMWYSYSGYLDGVKYLVSLGADIQAQNSDGQTAYDIAETFGHRELLRYLKSIGAKPGE